MIRFSLRLSNDLTLPTYITLAQTAEAAGFRNSGSPTTSSCAAIWSSFRGAGDQSH
ncbi:MAG: hypothetical protein R2838_06725 [Caldilineaceae bacterium]